MNKLGPGMVYEGSVAHLAKVGREQVERYRKEHLTEGKDWVLVNDRPAWVEAARKAYQAVLAEIPKDDPRKAPDPVRGVVVMGVIQNHRPGRNPKLVMVKNAVGDVIKVRVRDNSHYRPGMKILFKGTHSGWAVAHPDPRQPGRHIGAVQRMIISYERDH